MKSEHETGAYPGSNAPDTEYGLDRVLSEIKRERQRQVVVEGYGRLHDDMHGDGALARAAAAYAYAAGYRGPDRSEVPFWWPWRHSDWKPKDRRRDLVRAGALIAAEIERLDRAAARSHRSVG